MTPWDLSWSGSGSAGPGPAGVGPDRAVDDIDPDLGVEQLTTYRTPDSAQGLLSPLSLHSPASQVSGLGTAL